MGGLGYAFGSQVENVLGPVGLDGAWPSSS